MTVTHKKYNWNSDYKPTLYVSKIGIRGDDILTTTLKEIKKETNKIRRLFTTPVESDERGNKYSKYHCYSYRRAKLRSKCFNSTLLQ